MTGEQEEAAESTIDDSRRVLNKYLSNRASETLVAAQGGYTGGTFTYPGGHVPGGLPPVPEQRRYSYPPPAQQVTIDLVAFAEAQARTEKRALILDLLDKIDAVKTKEQSASRSWESGRPRTADTVLKEVRAIVKDAL